tara:strand:- start:3521 stop:4045 length:525 start_codon:yes stop_codon:yes gene_type:complete
MITQDKMSDIIISFRGVFLVVLIFSASYLSPYIGCNIQNILKKNAVMKHLLLFLLIFFTISLVSPLDKKVSNPLIELIKSAGVYFIFLLLNILDSYSVILVLILFALLVFTTNSHFYYKDTVVDKKKYKYIEDFMYIIELCLLIGIFIIIVMSLFKKKTRSLISSRFFKLEKCK